MNTKDILLRMGVARNEANLSARELSLRMGMSPQYIAKLESGKINLAVDKLIEVLTICEYPIEKFFYDNPNDYDADKELITLIKSLSSEKKQHLLAFLKSKS